MVDGQRTVSGALMSNTVDPDFKQEQNLDIEQPNLSTNLFHTRRIVNEDEDLDVKPDEISGRTGIGLEQTLSYGLAASWHRFTDSQANVSILTESTDNLLGGLGFDSLKLMDKERIDSMLNSVDDPTGEPMGDTVALLTDKRLVQLSGGPRRRIVNFVPLRNVDSVEIMTEQQGFRGYLWGGLAIFAAVVLWWVWDNPIGSIGTAALIACMGIYMIFDQILSPGMTMLKFTAGSAELQCVVDSDMPVEDIYRFVNRLFELKAEDA